MFPKVMPMLRFRSRTALFGAKFSTQMEATQKPHSCLVKGFSKSSSRLDLELVLGTQLKPTVIDPVLSKDNLFFTGGYLLTFNTEEEVSSLKDALKKHEGRFTVFPTMIEESNVLASQYHIDGRTVRVDFKTSPSPDYVKMWLLGYSMVPKQTSLKSGSLQTSFYTPTVASPLTLLYFASVHEARRFALDKSINSDRELSPFGEQSTIHHYQC